MPWTPALSAGERATGLGTRFVYERGKGLFPPTAESPEGESPDPALRRYLLPENSRLFGEHGTYVLVIELVQGALEQRALEPEGDVRLFKVSEIGHLAGDPEIVLSRARGFRVYESGGSRELNPPAYYAGTKLAFINDRKRGEAEMLVRSGDTTVTVKTMVGWPGSSRLTDGRVEVQFHDFVKRAVFLWGLDTVSLDVSALKAEV